MPRGKTNPVISSLSVNIPRHIHRAARMKCLRAGIPSFAAYVAYILDQAPERMSFNDVVAASLIEVEIAACTTRERTRNDGTT